MTVKVTLNYTDGDFIENIEILPLDNKMKVLVEHKQFLYYAESNLAKDQGALYILAILDATEIQHPVAGF